MKGAILAGGLGTRLYPLTYATNKHLLPVYDRPMVFYPIQTLVEAGITEVIIVTGGPHAGHFLRVLRNGTELGLKRLEFTFQEKEGGIAEALGLCEDFAAGDDIAVILGDNTTDASIKKAVDSFTTGAKVFLREVPDPKRFGVPVFAKGDPKKIEKILEKPKDPPNNLAVVGLYLYDKNVFKAVHSIKPSARGELEITDVNNWYAKQGKLSWDMLGGYWSDAGTFDSLHRSGAYWAEKTDKGK